MIDERAEKSGHSLVVSVPGGLKESIFVPECPPWSLGGHSTGGSAHNTWDKHLVAIADVLGNLDAENLGWAHLFIKEFDDPH
jgi:hypothetical protein